MDIQLPNLGTAKAYVYHNADYVNNWITRGDLAFFLDRGIDLINDCKDVRVKVENSEMVINGVTYTNFYFSVKQYYDGEIYVTVDALKEGDGYMKMTDSAKKRIKNIYGEALKRFYSAYLDQMRAEAIKDYTEAMQAEIERLQINFEKVNNILKKRGK